MKNILAIAALAALGAGIGFFSPAPVTAAETVVEDVPPGVTLSEIRRWVWNVNPRDHRTGPTGSFYSYVNEGPLGWVSSTAFANSHPLYACVMQYSGSATDMFTSGDANCEGKNHSVPFIIGYVSDTQIPGTTPLYRCRDNGNHFDSLAGSCEGHTGEGILGFVFI